MNVYIQTRNGKLIGPMPEEVAKNDLQIKHPGAIIIPVITGKTILRNIEYNRRENRRHYDTRY